MYNPCSMTERAALLFSLLIITTTCLLVSTRINAQIPKTPRIEEKENAGYPVITLPGPARDFADSGARSAATAGHKLSDSELSERLTTLEEALRSQNSKIEQMLKTIQEQQQTILSLTSKATNTEATAPSNTSEAVAATVEQHPVASQGPASTTDERLKKVEGDVLKLGRFRFSGDFRLRFDTILRRAEPNPPPGFSPLTHQQNARMRYRFRLNMDTDFNPKVSLHAQLSTGPINNPTSANQDFSGIAVRHPFFISEAWIDYHPNKNLQLQAGRVQEVFADNSRFMFDDDIRFNGFNERYTFHLKKPFAGVTSVELRAGQYIFTNPNVAIVTPGSPLAEAGEPIGSTGRSSGMFHQGVLVNQKLNETFSQQFGGDVQIYRNPNQIQLASTTQGAALLIQPGIGLALSGPMTGTGNATTTPGGAIFTVPRFQIARLNYTLNHTGFQHGDHAYPITFNVQLARNIGTGFPERDAMLAALQIGKITKRGDMAFLSVFAIKGANSMISQLTDDNIGTNSGVNVRTNYFRFEYGLTNNIRFQSLAFIQRELRNSGQFPRFFVPLNAFTPTQYRFQQQILFTF